MSVMEPLVGDIFLDPFAGNHMYGTRSFVYIYIFMYTY